VSSALNGSEGVVVVGLEIAGGSPVNVPRSPNIFDRFVQLEEAILGDGERHGEYINISSIDHDLHIRSLSEKLLVVWKHTGTTFGISDGIGAFVPSYGLSGDCSLNGRLVKVVRHSVSERITRSWVASVDGEVQSSVAQAKVLVQIIRIQRRLDVVAVSLLLIDLSDLFKDLSKDDIAFRYVAEFVASIVIPILLFDNGDESVVVEEVELDGSSVLIGAVDNRVSKCDTSQLCVDLTVGVVQDDSNESWNVNSCVTFTTQPGRSSLVLREGSQPIFDEDEVILSRYGIR